ncbi:MAG: SHOCT domain-containing protein [Anaerolineae bacterium]|nr:SHOCT domain-containing protein [Anaerolineae bacterium]
MAVRMRARRRRRVRRRRIILVGGAIALGTAAVHKYSKKDVERIEQQAGKPAEELTDEELAQATQQLGIQPQEMSDEEWDQVDAADAEDDAAEGYDDSAGDSSGDDPYEQLERLAELRDKGILTDEEFDAKKKQILDDM